MERWARWSPPRAGQIQAELEEASLPSGALTHASGGLAGTMRAGHEYTENKDPSSGRAVLRERRPRGVRTQCRGCV